MIRHEYEQDWRPEDGTSSGWGPGAEDPGASNPALNGRGDGRPRANTLYVATSMQIVFVREWGNAMLDAALATCLVYSYVSTRDVFMHTRISLVVRPNTTQEYVGQTF